MNHSRTTILVTLLVLCVLLTSCSGGFGGFGGRNDNSRINEYAKYYTGSDGIDARFEGFPTRMYYYGPDDNSGNAFTFGVEVWNKGASFSRGGVYVSGYDPNMIVIDQIPIAGGGLGGCGISFGGIGFGEYGLIARCDNSELIVGDRTSVRIDSLGDIIRDIGDKFNKNWWPMENLDFSVGYDDTGGTFWVNYNDLYGSIEHYQNGLVLLQLLAGVNFNLNHGQEFLLAGDTYEFPGGESDYFIFDGRVAEWPPGLDQTEQNFLLTSCYLYTTFADPVVCIDPDPFSDIRKVCYPQSRSWGGGNGAPVAITSIEQENTPKKVIFRVNVKNIGQGTVWDPGWMELCSPYYPGRVTLEHKNVVHLGDVRVGNRGLVGRGGREGITCYPSPIRLDPQTQSGSTTCTYPIEFTEVKSAYQTPLVVELWYGYSQTQQRNIIVKRVV